MSQALLRVEGLRKLYPVKSERLFGRLRELRAVDGVSFSLGKGEVLGVVGESGCGKSTLGRLILRLVEPTAGSVLFRGEDVPRLSPASLRELRRHVQMVFQDPLGSLNPRMSVGRTLVDVLGFHRIGDAAERVRRAREILDVIGLGGEYFGRLPHELSGGQCQRVGIARALILRPDLVVLDEPVSALDVSIRAQILKLLVELKQIFALTYVFISHDIGVVRLISDRIAVLYLGKLVEIAGAEELCAAPLHPYTQGLLRAVPVADPRANRVSQLAGIEGELPSPIDPPKGCRFRTRCPHAEPRCGIEEPPLFAVGATRSVACFLHEPKQAPGRESRHAVVAERPPRGVASVGQA
jgi:oligopeptide/dipeptide ABC transporter ATP-binding protein